MSTISIMSSNPQSNALQIFATVSVEILSPLFNLTRVYLLKCVFRIKSKSFLISLILKYNLEPTCVYSCKGVYSKKLNAVIVSLDESNLDLYNNIEPQG